MFDISFSELMVIAFVALVVIGPEKLPKVARTAGAFFGRLQRFVSQVKDEVNRESRFAELQTLQQEVQSSLQQGYDEIEQSILPTTAPAEVTPAPEVTKKLRKPRQRKAEAIVEDAAAEQPRETLPLTDAGSQAELFAVSAEKKKTRRPRNTTKKEGQTTPVSAQKPLA